MLIIILYYSCITFLEKLKVKLQNFSKANQLLLLDVLDFLVDKGNMNIWSTISSKKFFQSLLDLLRTRDIPEVQMKLLGLIQKWGLNFEDKRSALPNFYSVYNKLRNSNVQFPNDFESNYQKYLSNSNSNNYSKSNNYDSKDDYENENENSDKDDGETFFYMDSLKNKLKVPNFEHKYRRLVNFLVKMHENIQMANLLMESGERSGLKDIINTLREGNNTLIDTISGGRLKDEKLMEITLGTTEDINQTLNRDEDIKNGYKAKKFTSYFVLNNVIPIKNNNYNHRTRAKSTKPKKSIQRRDEKYKNYDMDYNAYDRNKYKEKMGGPKNADDIFDLFSASNPSNEPGYNQQQNNQPINNFFSSQTQFRGNNNNNQYPQLRNNPMNNIFNNNNNNRNTMMGNNNNNSINIFNSSTFQGNNMNNNNNNNFGRQFNQNNNQGPVMTNFDILEQKLNNLNLEQKNNFNFNSQSTQFNQAFNNNNNNMNNNNMNNNMGSNNNNNNNLMNMLDQLAPSQANANQLVPYIGNFNQNNQNNQNNNNFMNSNNNNNQFNNFNNNRNNQFNNNINNNNINTSQFKNFNNNINNNNNNNFNNNNNNINNNNQFNNFNSNQNNFGNNNNNGNMFNMSNNNNNNQINFDTNLGRSQNMNNNNFGMGQNNNQQMDFEEMEKQRKLKELDDLF